MIMLPLLKEIVELYKLSFIVDMMIEVNNHSKLLIKEILYSPLNLKELSPLINMEEYKLLNKELQLLKLYPQTKIISMTLKLFMLYHLHLINIVILVKLKKELLITQEIPHQTLKIYKN